MKTNKTRKTVIVTLAIALGLVTILASTFAWWRAQDEVLNRLATKDGLANVSIQETFVEPDDWKPGQTITKEVSIVNTGSAPAMVRVSFEELLRIQSPAVAETDTFDLDSYKLGNKPMLYDVSAHWGSMVVGSTDWNADGWFEVTTTAGPGGIELAADYSPVKVYAKHNTSGSTSSYEFVMVAPIASVPTGGLSGTDLEEAEAYNAAYAGKYQTVAFTREWNNADKILTLKGPMDKSATPPVPFAAPRFMTYGPVVSQAADWRTAAFVAETDIGSSDAERIINAMAAPYGGNYNQKLLLNYDAQAQTLADDTWFYNEDDGYFYFIGIVEGGTNTSKLLESLKLDESASQDYYSNMVFDLTVHSDAIQNTKDALAATDGWNLPAGALRTALEAFCES